MMLLNLVLRLTRPAKVMYIGGSDVLPTPLKAEEERELLSRLTDEDARQTLMSTICAWWSTSHGGLKTPA